MVAEIRIKEIDDIAERVQRLEDLFYSETSRLEKRWYSIAEAAEYLGVSAITVRRLLERGLLKRSGAIRHVRIPVESLEEYSKISVF